MILIISQNKKRANALSDIFYYMGILSHALTPKETVSELSLDYGAAVIINPGELPDARDFLAKIRRIVSDLPLISISDTPLSERLIPLFDLNMSDGIYSTTMVRSISSHCINRGKRAIGSYSLAGIDAGCDLRLPTYFDKEITLTKTETMILRYLIRIYPRKAKAVEILNHAFKSGRDPEVASVRTHISVMNKKFKKEFGKNLISSFEGGGYTVLTPEYAESREILTV